MEGSVIGVSLGTRIAGIAVMKNRELIVYKVKVFKDPWSEQKQNEILILFDKLYEHYGVKFLAIKLVSSLHSSKAVDGLIQSAIERAKKKGIKVKTMPLEEIRRSLGLNKRQSLGEYVVSKHPELRREYEVEKNSDNKYYTKMFESIAIAHILDVDNPY
jgi:hypothetical protein